MCRPKLDFDIPFPQKGLLVFKYFPATQIYHLNNEESENLSKQGTCLGLSILF